MIHVDLFNQIKATAEQQTTQDDEDVAYFFHNKQIYTNKAVWQLLVFRYSLAFDFAQADIAASGKAEMQTPLSWWAESNHDSGAKQ